MPEKVFTLLPLILTIPAVIAAILVGISILAFIKKQHFGVALLPLIVAIIPGGIFFPAMYMDKVRVNSERIEQTTGIPLFPTIKGFVYKEVNFVKIKAVTDDHGRTQNIWEVHYKNGEIRDLDPGDLWDINSTEIIQLLTGNSVIFK